MLTQKQLYYAAERKSAHRNQAMLDLLYGVNPITDKELLALIAKRPNVYWSICGICGQAPGNGGVMRVENDRFTYEISEAVRDVCAPDPYITSGQIERLQHQVDELTGLVGRLFEALAKNGNLRANEVDQIFNYNFTVVEEK